jgi:hypothetical protein
LDHAPSNITQASDPSKITNKQKEQLRTYKPNKKKALKERTKG